MLPTPAHEISEIFTQAGSEKTDLVKATAYDASSYAIDILADYEFDKTKGTNQYSFTRYQHVNDVDPLKNLSNPNNLDYIITMGDDIGSDPIWDAVNAFFVLNQNVLDSEADMDAAKREAHCQTIDYYGLEYRNKFSSTPKSDLS